MVWRSEDFAIRGPRERIDGASGRSAYRARHVSGRTAVRRAVLAHLDAAYNLACWLVGGEVAAEVVYEAMAGALASRRSFRDGDASVRVLRCVRDAAYARLGIEPAPSEADESADNEAPPLAGLVPGTFSAAAGTQLDALLEQLPVEVRECLVLRELHQASYREIAAIAEIEIDDVRRRLWRGRRLLARLAADLAGDSSAKRE